MRQKTVGFILFAIIAVLASVFRFHALGGNPPGLTHDEADIAYDAYSIAKTGRDQWGVPYPFPAMRGFGDWRPAVYTYAAVPTVAIFGPTPFAVRLPSAVAGTLTVGVMFLLGMLLTGSMVGGTAAAFLTAVNPWHIAMSRSAIESDFSVFFLSLGLCAFLLGRKRPVMYAISAVLFGFAAWSYTAAIFFVPPVILLLVFLYRHDVVRAKAWIAAGTIVLALMFLPFVAAGSPGTAGTRISQVGLIHDTGIVDVVNERQGACKTAYAGTLCQTVDNRYWAYARKFIDNYLEHFSPRLLFIKGTDTQLSVMPPRGLFYLFELVLGLFGFFWILRYPGVNGWLIVGWIILAPVADSLTGDGHFSRFFIAFPAFVLLESSGVVHLAGNGKRLSIVSGAAVALLAVYEISMFTVDYTAYYPKFYSRYSHFGYRELTDRLIREKGSYDRILVSNAVNDEKQYIFYVLYSKYDPALFQSGSETEKTVESGGWVRVSRIGNVYFVPSFPQPEWMREHAGERILIVGAPSEFPTNRKFDPVFDVKDLGGNVLFRAVEMRQLPVQPGNGSAVPAAFQ